MPRSAKVIPPLDVALSVEPPKIKSGQRWGNWRYAKAANTLTYCGPGVWAGVYGVPLERCETFQEAMGMIFHMANKSWVSAEDLGHLVRALRDIKGAHTW